MKKFLLVTFLILFTVSIHSQEWKFLTPVKRASSISNIEVTSNQTLYLLDTSYPNGIVASSSDFGVTWRKLFRNGGYRDIQMLSDNTGFILKQNELIKTENSFQTNSVTTIPATLHGMHFIDIQTGFVCGTGGNVLKTIDGGITFNFASVGASVNLNDVYFVNSQTGFVIGANGIVYKTTDQAASWSPTSLSSTSLNKILFIDANTGFIVGNNGKVFKTNDQGATWNSLVSNTLYNLSDIKFFNNVLYSVGQASRVIKSSDLGATWTEQTIASYPYPDLYSLGFVNNKILVGGSGNIFSTDNTTTWNLFIKGVYESNLSDISFSDNNRGVIVGGTGPYSVAYSTSDGGNTWIDRKVSSSNYAYNAVSMKQTGKGLMVGQGSYHSTTDFGQTWSGPYSSTPVTALSECWLKSNDDYLIGTNPGGNIGDGLILKNSQGWSQFTNITGIVKIEFYDDQLGFAGSQYGKLYKTINGGVSWTELTSYNNNNSIFKIEIVTPNKIYVNNSLSVDGGATWSSVNYPPADYHFINEQSGLGYNGNVYKTTDGGNSWSIIVPSAYYFNSFLTPVKKFYYFPDKIIAIGNLSDIYILHLGNSSLATEEISTKEKSNFIFPNPAVNELFFKNDIDIKSVQVFDVQGRFQNIKHLKKSIDLSALKPGIYFIKFLSGNKWKTEKFIKK